MTTDMDGQQQNGSTAFDKQQWLSHAFREYSGMMCRAANAVLRQADQAEDVVQNLFAGWMGKDLSPEVMRNPKSYLYRAARNAALDLKKSRERRKETDRVEELDIQDGRSARANDNIRDRLEGAFSGVKAHIAEILSLHYYHGYTDSEIARMLNQTRSRIASTLSRWRIGLRAANPSGALQTA